MGNAINSNTLDYKVCFKCGEKKKILLFPKYKLGNKVYYRGACKECWHKQIVNLKRDYSYKNPIYFYFHIRATARKRRLGVLITKKDFSEWWSSQEQRCFYCKRSFSEIQSNEDKLNKRLRRLTIDRINNKLGYTIDNIVLCCYRCNTVKGDYFNKYEMLKIGKIINNKSRKSK